MNLFKLLILPVTCYLLPVIILPIKTLLVNIKKVEFFDLFVFIPLKPD